MQAPHHPKVARRPDGTWVVECAQCSADRTSDPPIGIDMPIERLETAELLRENHAGPHGRRLAS